MARIRTIKPEFWTSEQITECSLSARLLFIGMWNFADDGGNLSASIKTAKMQIFPSDNIDIAPLVVELIRAGLLVEYFVNDRNYWHITGWKHQVINRPSPLKHPKFSEDLRRTHGALTEHSREERKGKEGNIGENLLSVPAEPTSKKKSYPVEFEEFWKGYPTDSNMSKATAAKQFARLSAEDRAMAIRSLSSFRSYCKARPDYRPVHACRYISDRRFEGHAQSAEPVAAAAKLISIMQDSPQGRAWDTHYRATKGKGVPWSNGVWRFPAEWPPNAQAGFSGPFDLASTIGAAH